MSTELVLHVGIMKSGTTFIQELLSGNRNNLEKHAWSYPGQRLNQQHACYSLCGQDIPWVKTPYSTKLGSDLIKKIRIFDGNVLISSEALSTLSDDGISQFLSKIGQPTKIIFTVRGLTQILPSAWQQYLKGGGRTSFGQFLQRLKEQRKDMSGFWRTYAYGTAIKRWSKYCDVEVVIVPDKTEDQYLLWKLFCEAANLPVLDPVEVIAEKSNLSLTAETAEILLQMNKYLPNKNKIADEIRKQYLEKFIFPISGHRIGNKIAYPQRMVEVVELWNREESEILLEHSSKIYGKIGNLDYVNKHLPLNRDKKVAKEAAIQIAHFLGYRVDKI